MKTKYTYLLLVMVMLLGLANTSFAKNERLRLSEEYQNNASSTVNKMIEKMKRSDESAKVALRLHASSTKEVVGLVKKIEDRNKIKTFFIGIDYKNLGQLRKNVVQTRNSIDSIKREIEKMASTTDKVLLQDELKKLEAEQTSLENFIKQNESKFSLFGWLRKNN